jgi:predicted amidohydrolase YtcJ
MVDVLVTDADIVTMAAGAEPARSMLVLDGRIAAVGPAERVHGAAPPGTRVVRLEGAAVIPGLIDAHCHLCDVGYLASGADCRAFTASTPSRHTAQGSCTSRRTS